MGEIKTCMIYKNNIRPYHIMQRIGIYSKALSKKKSEPNEWGVGEYLVKKIQVNVKYVLKKCKSPELQEMGEKYY